MKDEETQLQIAAVNLLQYVLPIGAVIHHSHNEGKRSKREGGIAKAMGQRAGFADLMIMFNRVVYFIEFKSKKGSQSTTQKAFEADIAAQGFEHYAIIRSIPELVGTIRAWGLEARKIGNHGPLPNPDIARC